MTLDQVGQAVTNILLNPTTGNVGIGTANPLFKFDVAGITQIQDYLKTSFVVSTSTATSTFAGGLYASLISSPYFHATSTTATSTFAGGLSVSVINQTGAASSTFANGIQLATGCFQMSNGICLSAGGSGTVGASTLQGQLSFYNSVGTTLTATSSIFLSQAGYVGIGTSNTQAKLTVGNLGVNNSVDSQVLISRAVDDSVSGNGHGFSDSSNITRGGVIGYNSYDARINYSGSNSYDHYAAFQAAPTYSSSGNITNLEGYTYAPTLTNGTVTNSYGLYVNNPTVSGGAQIGNLYGLYIYANNPIGTSTNYAIYTYGVATSSFGGPVIMKGTTVQYRSKLFVTDDTSWSPTRNIEIHADGGTNTGIRIYQNGQNYWDLLSPASKTRFDIQDASGIPFFSVLGSGSVGIGTTTPTANLQVTTSTANATTSVQFGKANQNKGTCLTLYDTNGGPVYAFIAAGASAFTFQNGGTPPSGCQN